MPPLRRSNVKPLLRVVNGKQHATDDDHADEQLHQLPTPPTTAADTMDENDLARSPVSSDDEEDEKSASHFLPPRQLEVGVESLQERALFRRPAALSSPSAASIPSKRSSQSVGASGSDDSDSGIFGREPGRNKKRRREAAVGFTNIHAPPRPARKKTYGSQQARESPKKIAALHGGGLKKPKGSLDGKVKEEERPKLAEFKRALGADMFEFSGGAEKVEMESRFRKPGDPHSDGGNGHALGAPEDDGRNSLSPSLSPPASSLEVQELHSLDISAQAECNSSPPAPACPICNESVDTTLKQDFQDKFTNGLPFLNYKWQQRFCHWHKEQDAKRIQGEKGYPEIDWDRLTRRMRRHNAYLKDVLTGVKESYYREQLRERLREGSKTALKAFTSADGKAKVGSVGYYGPRGERVMTEHIVSNLSSDIRTQATKDRLVAAVGVSGGVSGFVQAVLVPELAEQLVQEDMNVSSARARDVLTDSAELGDLLHPDV